MPFKDVSIRKVHQQTYTLKRRRNLISLGLCSNCGKFPLKDTTRCEKCANERKLHSRQWQRKLKLKVLNAYGGVCKCCGEKEVNFLTIDHINNDGAQHRRSIRGRNNGGAGQSFYGWIVRNNYPNDLQVLCMNCNFGKKINKGVCPHQDKQGEV
jgi:hypothetical protein